jgi:hypothetical protein
LKNPHLIYGAIDSKTKKFKIYDNRDGKSRAGRVCMEGGCKISDLHTVFYEIDHLPFKNEISEEALAMKKPALILSIKDNKNFKMSPFSANIDLLSSYDREKLMKLVTLFTMNKLQLCNSLEKYFKENDKYVTV